MIIPGSDARNPIETAPADRRDPEPGTNRRTRSCFNESFSPGTAAQERGSARCCGKEWVRRGGGAHEVVPTCVVLSLPRHHADPGQSEGLAGEKGSMPLHPFRTITPILTPEPSVLVRKNQSKNASVETNSLIFVAISSIVSSAVSNPLREARRGLSSRRSS